MRSRIVAGRATAAGPRAAGPAAFVPRSTSCRWPVKSAPRLSRQSRAGAVSRRPPCAASTKASTPEKRSRRRRARVRDADGGRSSSPTPWGSTSAPRSGKLLAPDAPASPKLEALIAAGHLGKKTGLRLLRICVRQAREKRGCTDPTRLADRLDLATDRGSEGGAGRRHSSPMPISSMPVAIMSARASRRSRADRCITPPQPKHADRSLA